MELAAAHGGAVDGGLELEAAAGCHDGDPTVGYAAFLLVQELDNLLVCYDVGIRPDTWAVGS